MAEWWWNEFVSCTNSCNMNEDGEILRMRIKMPAEPMRSVSRARVHLVSHDACIPFPGSVWQPGPASHAV